MHRLILGTVAAAMAFGISSAGFAMPVFNPHDHGDPNHQGGNVHRAEYYWNHHHYQHRNWDRHYHRWHYYD
jgi:hypothetical protein